MGFFSFMATDTNKSISNKHSNRGALPVSMKDNAGTVYVEPNYDGYGIFGGKDIFVLIAEMNGYVEGDLRSIGLDLYYSRIDYGILFPNLLENPNLPWVNAKLKNCKHQGYFYFLGE